MSITRSGTTTAYELTVPWAALGFSAKPSNPFGLSLVVADDDNGQGRAGWIEWGGGIATTKDPSLLRPVQLIE
ncbi:hypothetical protein GCM10025864_14250 [Luteimicrobium album]|uniref:Uncharacterized protein n=1 Tax=Luteimicrobium album TaxID=1054550 RepID=A0ABQ6HYU7_9MICO|nr:hypothetical protein GCM10025864_14250 [Luteimicrobium album]